MTRLVALAVVAVAFVIAFVADLVVDASWPGRIALFGLASSAVLVLGAKALGGAGLSRPARSRVGEVGDPRDDLDGTAPWEERRA